jgi:hypothetical protein
MVVALSKLVAARDGCRAAKFVDRDGCFFVLGSHPVMVPGITGSIEGCLNTLMEDEEQTGAVNGVLHVKQFALFEVVEDLPKGFKGVLADILPKPFDPHVVA